MYRLEVNLPTKKINQQMTFDLTAFDSQSKKPKATLDKIKLLSLFSGCGGLDLGFIGGFHFRNQKYKKNKFNLVLQR